ncbi:MAG: hypothetical protein ACI4RP_07030 [Acutalibacteraceae bacterium]
MKYRASKKSNNNEEYNPRLKKLIIEVVENQIRENNPPAANITFERLIAKGYSEQQAKEKIAAVALMHIYDILKEGKPFDGDQYVKDLSAIE